MKFTTHCMTALAASSLLLGASAAWATAAPEPLPRAASAATPASAARAATRQRAALVKPVDINSASEAQLTKLPGITTADARRIIAGRPYLTKAHLVTHKVIPMGTYQRIDLMIIATQPATTKEVPAASR